MWITVILLQCRGVVVRHSVKNVVVRHNHLEFLLSHVC